MRFGTNAIQCPWLTARVRAVLAVRWGRFGIVGGAASVSYALLGLLFVNGLRLPALWGNALAYVLSFIVSYLGQSLWTFRAAGSAVGAACHRVMTLVVCLITLLQAYPLKWMLP